MLKAALRICNPSKIVALHRTLQFKLLASCGKGFRATERSVLFSHGTKKSAINFGDHALIDGTVEVYDKGRLTVGCNFFLGRSRIYCANDMRIGDYVLVSDNVSIMDSDLHPMKASDRRLAAGQWAAGAFPDSYSNIKHGQVSIADDVWIGYGASILKGVSIGRGAIVGAGAVVTSDVEEWTIVVGSPARVVRKLGEYER